MIDRERRAARQADTNTNKTENGDDVDDLDDEHTLDHVSRRSSLCFLENIDENERRDSG